MHTLTRACARAAAVPRRRRGRVRHADYRCVCGGDLTDAGPALVHTHTCDRCRDQRVKRCKDRAEHRACAQPEAIQCDHYGCHALHNINNGPCAADHAACCGCCHDDDQYTD